MTIRPLFDLAAPRRPVRLRARIGTMDRSSGSAVVTGAATTIGIMETGITFTDSLLHLVLDRNSLFHPVA